MKQCRPARVANCNCLASRRIRKKRVRTGELYFPIFCVKGPAKGDRYEVLWLKIDKEIEREAGGMSQGETGMDLPATGVYFDRPDDDDAVRSHWRR